MGNKRFEKASENWAKYLVEIMNKYKIPYYDILKLEDLHSRCVIGALDDAEEKIIGALDNTEEKLTGE
ncbi:MAG: hypothetical protein MJ126_05800 [Lachnospiraceae bacterium]|nr:hypothetical protein [Lachnospiraceae bacterium]